VHLYTETQQYDLSIHVRDSELHAGSAASCRFHTCFAGDRGA